MSVMVLIASVLSAMIGVHIMKLTKTLRTENKQNGKQIMKLFSERWDQAEALFKDQACENNAPKPVETQATGGVLTFTVESTGLSRDNPHGRSLCLQ